MVVVIFQWLSVYVCEIFIPTNWIQSFLVSLSGICDKSSSLQFIENLFNTTQTQIKTISSTNLLNFFLFFILFFFFSVHYCRCILFSSYIFCVRKRQNLRCVQSRIKTPATLDHVKHSKKKNPIVTWSAVDRFCRPDELKLDMSTHVIWLVETFHKSSCS